MSSYNVQFCSLLFHHLLPRRLLPISHRACQACHYLGLGSISCYCFFWLPVQGFAMDSRFTQSPHPKKMQSKKNDNILFFSTSNARLCYGLSLYAVATPAPWRPTSSRLVLGMDNWIVSLECPGPRCPSCYACKVLADMQSTRQVQCEVSCYLCPVWVSFFLPWNRCETSTVVHAVFVFSFLGFLVLCSLFYLSFFGILYGW